MNIETRIEELKELPVAKIRAHLTLDNFSGKEIDEAIREAGLTTKRVSFANEFYSWLAEEVRDEDEANAYIMGNGEYGETSRNVQAHLNHYMNIWKLSVAIWEK